jgi:flagellar assembly protein FliH
VDDVEKKLSPDRQASGTAAAAVEFHLHCFPDIAGSPLHSRHLSDGDGACFQRAVPGAGSGCCGPTVADIEASDQAPTVEEAEQLGYERGVCEGEARGRADGEKEGLEKGRQSVLPVIDALGSLIEDLTLIREKTLQQLESEIVALATGVARKIVGRELAVRPELVATVVRQALNQLESAGSICIKLNPDDIALLNELKADLFAGGSEPAAIAFKGDPSIERGGCVIETDAGDIDARLETQFQAIEDSFQAALADGRSQG